MLTTKNSVFITLLSAEFEQNPDEAKACKEKSRHALETNDPQIIPRIFDDFFFPLTLRGKKIGFVDQTQIADFANTFAVMLKQLSPNAKGCISKNNDINEMKKWVNSITKLACQELLDENGHIKQEVITLLDWPSDISQENIHTIICAYWNAVNQEMIVYFEQNNGGLLKDNFEKYNAFNAYLYSANNRIFSKWIAQVMLSTGQVFDADGLCKKYGLQPVKRMTRQAMHGLQETTKNVGNMFGLFKGSKGQRQISNELSDGWLMVESTEYKP